VSLGRRQAGLVRASVVDAATPVALELPDGPGYYVLRRVSCERTAGAAAATISPILSEDATATPSNTVFQLAAAVVLPAAVLWPAAGTGLGEPARYGLFASGVLHYTVGADVAGDTYTVAVLAERIR